MITIGRPYIYEDDQFAYLKAPIHISNDTALAYKNLQHSYKHVHWRVNDNYPPIEWNKDDCGLWFSVPKEYKDYLCAERADAFVVAMIWYAMTTKSDIESIAPISTKLAFGIQELLIPALMKPEKGFDSQIHLIAPTSDLRCGDGKSVGTGMSCGVDALYSLKKYTADTIPTPYRLTHLLYLNMGSIFHPDRASKKEYTLQEFYETTDRMSLEKSQNAREVAEIAGLSYIYIKSNLDEDYYRGAYGDTCVYRNCACILALQKLFSVYYCSSAGVPNFLDLSINEGSEHYELMLCEVFSTEDTKFILSDYTTRLEKTIAIADDLIAQRYLDVCFRFMNCGTCSKCCRTLVTLDVLGKVDLFEKAFDVKKFKENRDKAYAWLLWEKDGDPSDDDAVYAIEIYDYMMRNKIPVPHGAMDLYLARKRRQTLGGRIINKLISTTKRIQNLLKRHNVNK